MKLLDLTQPDLDALVEERDRLRIALEEVEWQEIDTGSGQFCPYCDQAKPAHAPDCFIGFALGRPECLVREPGR